MEDMKFYKIKMQDSDEYRKANIAVCNTAVAFVEDIILVADYIERNKFIKVMFENEKTWTLLNTAHIEIICECV